MKVMTMGLVASVLLLSSAAASAGEMPATIQKALEFREFSPANRFMWFEDGFDPPEPGWTTIDVSGAGQYWHLTQRPCLTWWKPVNSYVCDNDPDTTSLPGGLDCWLVTPQLPLSGYEWCTVFYAANMHFDYDDGTGTWWGAQYTHHISVDGGATWLDAGTFVGDMERHYNDSACGILGWFIVDIEAYAFQSFWDELLFAIGIETDPSGASGCAASNTCWFALEFIWIMAGWNPLAVEPTPWSEVKSLFR